MKGSYRLFYVSDSEDIPGCSMKRAGCDEFQLFDCFLLHGKMRDSFRRRFYDNMGPKNIRSLNREKKMNRQFSFSNLPSCGAMCRDKSGKARKQVHPNREQLMGGT